jgi:putative transposase
VATGGLAFHVLNRAVGRQRLFRKQADYAAFVRVIDEVCRRLPVPILSYCLMPNHWHLALWPQADGQLSEFMRLITVTHTQRYHAHYHTAGTGPLYQGRFKSFPIQRDPHLLTVCRYVERNALRANMVKRAESWRWCSLWDRFGGDDGGGGDDAEEADGSSDVGMPQPPSWLLPMDDWPVPVRPDWLGWVNQPQHQVEQDALAQCIRRGTPFGDDRWQRRTAKRLGLASTLRPRGRPRVTPIKDSRPL